MQEHFIKVLIGVAIAVIVGTIGVVASDHNTIIVHGERLEEVKSLKVAVDDLRTTGTDTKMLLIEVRSEVKVLNSKADKQEEALKKLESATRRKGSR